MGNPIVHSLFLTLGIQRSALVLALARLLTVVLIVVSPTCHAISSQVDSATYRYRLTVNVGTGSQNRSGSSVIEVKLTQEPEPRGSTPLMYPSVQGEAVFVDLGDGRNLVALLASGSNGQNVNYPYQIVPLLTETSHGANDLSEVSGLRGKWRLSEKQMPVFVTFKNTDDPTTAQIVPPDRFDEIFGPEVRLQSVVLEITKDAPTQLIQEKIPWIGNYALETAFERTLRLSEKGVGPAMTPGMNLKRKR